MAFALLPDAITRIIEPRLRRVRFQRAIDGIEDCTRAIGNLEYSVARCHEHRNPGRCGKDRNVRRRSAFCRADPGHAFLVQTREF